MEKPPQAFEIMDFGDGNCALSMDCLGAFVGARLQSAKYHNVPPKPLKSLKTTAQLRSFSDRLKGSASAVRP
jgi:hypothetical protein